LKSVKMFFLAGVLPLLGCVMMFYVFGKAFHDYSAAGSGYAKPLFGIQIPIVIGIGTLLLGVPLMLLAAVRFRPFFRRRLEVAPEGSL
jgi:hypothetical protein